MNRQSDRTIIPVRHVIRRRLVLLFSVLLIPAALTMSCSTSGDPNNEVNGAGTARVSGSRPAVVASTQPATAALHSRSAHPTTSTETYEVTPRRIDDRSQCSARDFRGRTCPELHRRSTHVDDVRW